MFATVMFMSLCAYAMATSFVYVVIPTGPCGVGVSYVYMLNSVGDRTPSYRTPVLNWRYIDVLPLNVVYALFPPI